MKSKKDYTELLSDLKTGIGNASNSARWKVAYSKDFDAYFGMLHFSSYAGTWQSIHIISKETYDKAGTYKNDDYKTEQMIRKGEQIYRYDNDRCCPEPIDIVLNHKYDKICIAMQQIS